MQHMTLTMKACMDKVERRCPELSFILSPFSGCRAHRKHVFYGSECGHVGTNGPRGYV